MVLMVLVGLHTLLRWETSFSKLSMSWMVECTFAPSPSPPSVGGAAGVDADNGDADDDVLVVFASIEVVCVGATTGDDVMVPLTVPQLDLR